MSEIKIERTPNEFREAVEQREITFWPTHPCSMCGYQCGYVFASMSVGYDRGCYCTGGGDRVERRTWREVADHYNMQSSPAVIAKMDLFWGFDPRT